MRLPELRARAASRQLLLHSSHAIVHLHPPRVVQPAVGVAGVPQAWGFRGNTG